MAIEAVKIPQNVYVEDRIIGPVTLKQLIIVGLGSGLSYIIYSMAAKAGNSSIPVIIVSCIPGIISAAFAFVKINDLSLFNIALLMIERFGKPMNRSWVPHPGISINIVTKTSKKDTVQVQEKQVATQHKLTELTRQLEEHHKQLSTLIASTRQAQASTESSLSGRGDSPESGQPVEVWTADPTTEESSSTPQSVDPSRISVSPLSPNSSVDSVRSQELDAYSHLFRKQ